MQSPPKAMPAPRYGTAAGEIPTNRRSTGRTDLPPGGRRSTRMPGSPSTRPATAASSKCAGSSDRQRRTRKPTPREPGRRTMQAEPLPPPAPALCSTYPYACRLLHLKGIHIDPAIGRFRIFVRQYGNDGKVLAGADCEGCPALPFRFGRVKIQCGPADAIDSDIRHAAVSPLGINIGQRAAPERKTNFGAW